MRTVTRLTREVRWFVRLECNTDRSRSTVGELANSWLGSPYRPRPAARVRLRLTVERPVHPATGYLEDIGTLDRWMRHALQEVEQGESSLRTWETWLPRVAEGIERQLPADLRWIRLELSPCDQQSFSLESEDQAVMHVTRQYEFSAAHRLHSPQLTDEQNRAVFGKCNNPYGHGHNYLLDVSLCGVVSPETQVLLAEDQFDQVVQRLVIQRLDHKFLNLEVPEFRELNPSVENIAQVIWNWLEGQFAPARLERIRVYETAKTWADVTASPGE